MQNIVNARRDLSSGQTGFQISQSHINSGGQRLSYHIRTSNTTGTTISSESSLPTNKWSHLTFIYDINDPVAKQRMYINGVLENDTQNPIISLNVTDTYNIGVHANTWQDYNWNGWMFDMRHYNVALSQNEIEKLMTLGQDPINVTPVMRLPFNTTPEEVITDHPEIVVSNNGNLVTMDATKPRPDLIKNPNVYKLAATRTINVA